MDEIKQLDNKYLVLKWDDIEKYLTPRGLKQPLMELDGRIALSRKLEGKKNDNRYVVLNLDDEINLGYLIEKIKFHEYQSTWNNHTGYKSRVKHIAVDLVNAILKAKQEHD